MHLSDDGWVVLWDQVTDSYKPAFHRNDVPPEIFNVLRGALTMYQALHAHLAGMERARDIAENFGQKEFAAQYDAIAVAANFVLRVAENGREKFTIPE